MLTHFEFYLYRLKVVIFLTRAWLLRLGLILLVCKIFLKKADVFNFLPCWVRKSLRVGSKQILGEFIYPLFTYPSNLSTYQFNYPLHKINISSSSTPSLLMPYQFTYPVHKITSSSTLPYHDPNNYPPSIFLLCLILHLLLS